MESTKVPTEEWVKKMCICTEELFLVIKNEIILFARKMEENGNNYHTVN